MREHAECVSGSRRGGQPDVGMADAVEKKPEYIVISFPLPRTTPLDRRGGAPRSPRLCRRISKASSVANRVLGKRMKILVLGGQQ